MWSYFPLIVHPKLLGIGLGVKYNFNIGEKK